MPASASASASEECSESYASLKLWLLRHGAVIHPSVDIFRDGGDGGDNSARPSTSYRGLRTSSALAPSTLLVSVPRRLLLSSGGVSSDNLPTALVREMIKETNKAGSSFYSVYLATLPQRAEYHILSLWTNEQARHLQASYALARWKRLQQQLSESVTTIQNKIGSAATTAMCEWAVATVSTRAVYATADEPGGVLCPFGDMHNYQPPQKACGTNVGDAAYDAQTETLNWTTKKAYTRGSEVFMTYGTYTSLDLLEYYGFLLPPRANDDHETFELCDAAMEHLDNALPLPRGDSALNRAVGAAGVLSVDTQGTPSYALLVRARAGALHAAGTDDRVAADKVRVGEPLKETSLECTALRAIARCVHADLNGAPTSLEEDKALQRKTCSDDLRFHLALSWRIAWKSALICCRQTCDASAREDDSAPNRE